MSACRECGRLLGFDQLMCAKCGTWAAGESGAIGTVTKNKTITLDQVSATTIERLCVGPPWDICFGGGIVPTSITLAGGSPGGGKSTAFLQILSRLAEITGRRGFYLSAEQGPGDLRIMAERLHIPNMDRFRVLSEFGVGAEIDEELLNDDPPAGMVVDSVSALVGKDRHAAVAIAKRFKLYSTKYKAPSFLICHMTKEHDFAGLLALQHEVDTLITIFPEDDGSRHLKPWKNRYGSTHGEFKLVMTERGLVSPPTEPEPDRPRRRRKVESLDSTNVAELDGQRLVRKARPQP